MPLRSGRSKEAFRWNVGELLRAFKKTGRIGRVRPKSFEHARRIALAVAFQKKKGG